MKVKVVLGRWGMEGMVKDWIVRVVENSTIKNRDLPVLCAIVTVVTIII